jgi:hypothetical protein
MFDVSQFFFARFHRQRRHIRRVHLQHR